MAFPDGWGRKCKLTVDSTYVDGTSHSDFPVLLTEDNLPSGMFDADGSYPALNGGGDIRFSSDADGSTQLPCEVVSFVTDNNPANGTAQIWVKLSSISGSADTDFYIWYNKTGETQPAVTDTYGRNAVWSVYEGVWHFEEDPSGSSPQMVDSTGNGHDGTTTGTMTSGDSIAGKIGNELDFDGSDDGVTCGTDSALATTDYTFYCWVDVPSSLAENKVIMRTRQPNGVGFWYNTNKALTVTSSDGTLSGYLVTGTSVLAQSGSTDTRNSTCMAGVRYNSTTDELHILYNGTEDGERTSVGTPNTAGSQELAIGFENRDLILYYESGIDEVRLASSALSTDWLGTDYNNQNSPSTFVTSDTPVYPFLTELTVVDGMYLYDPDTRKLEAEQTDDFVFSELSTKIQQAINQEGLNLSDLMEKFSDHQIDESMLLYSELIKKQNHIHDVDTFLFYDDQTKKENKVVLDSILFKEDLRKELLKIHLDGLHIYDVDIKTRLHIIDEFLLLSSQFWLKQNKLNYDEIVFSEVQFKTLSAIKDDQVLLYDNQIIFLEKTIIDKLLLSDTSSGTTAKMVTETITDYLLLSDEFTKKEEKTILDNILIDSLYNFILSKIISLNIVLNDYDLKERLSNISENVLLFDDQLKKESKNVKDNVLLDEKRVSRQEKNIKDSLDINSLSSAYINKLFLDNLLFSDFNQNAYKKVIQDNVLFFENFIKLYEAKQSEGLFLYDSYTKSVTEYVIELLVYARLASIDLLGMTIQSKDNYLNVEYDSVDLLGLQINTFTEQ